MTADILIGLDLGTTSAKAAAFDARGACLAEASVPYPTLFPGPFRIEQRPADWLRALTEAMRGVVAALGERKSAIVGIGLSAQGPSALFVDARGEPLTETCPTWQDERAMPYGKRLLDAVGPEWMGPGMPLSGFPARLLCALAEQPEVAARATYALGVKDTLVGWLTGRFATEPSSGPGRDTWWRPVFDACGWPVDRLAPVLPSTAVAGELTQNVAREFGLQSAVPVVIGLNDGASATLAGGITRAGEIIITVSTNGVVRVVLDERVPPEDRLAYSLFCWPYAEGRWIAGGFAKVGASALDWFARATIGEADDAARETLLAEAAASVPGSRGVLFVPYLAGRGTPNLDERATATFLNMRLSHERGDLTRAVLEGVAFSLRDVLEHFRAHGLQASHAHITGGGIRSALWRQILADVLGLPLQRYAGDSSLGAAIVAAVGLGLYADVTEAAASMTRPLDETMPEGGAVAIYEELYQDFGRRRDELFPAIGSAVVAREV